jgi:hypothetical protein
MLLVFSRKYFIFLGSGIGYQRRSYLNKMHLFKEGAEINNPFADNYFTVSTISPKIILITIGLGDYKYKILDANTTLTFCQAITCSSQSPRDMRWKFPSKHQYTHNTDCG